MAKHRGKKSHKGKHKGHRGRKRRMTKKQLAAARRNIKKAQRARWGKKRKSKGGKKRGKHHGGKKRKSRKGKKGKKRRGGHRLSKSVMAHMESAYKHRPSYTSPAEYAEAEEMARFA